MNEGDTSQQNIVLTGFMGTGKTSAGHEVALRLGRRFVDLDDIIVSRAGKPIAEIFDRDGEPAFRALEREVCRELAAPAGLVIATGGGAVLDPANRKALAAGGCLICLDATPQAIVSRLAGQDGRPLLMGADRLARAAELLAQRESIYAALPYHIDTTHLGVRAVAERVMGIVAGLPTGGYRIRVRTDLRRETDGREGISAAGSGSGVAAMHPGFRTAEAPCYDILLANGLLALVGARLAAAGLMPGRCAVVTNPTVSAHHGAALLSALRGAGYEPVVFEVPDGEAYKTTSTLATLYGQLAASGFSRQEGIVAFGGGVVGDLAGLAAATWLRGVPFVQVPTTLLAMVDASIGGKSAVDLPQGKNLVGAFKQPDVVIIDPLLLGTLPGIEFRNGLSEVLKAAVIGAPALFEDLAGPGPSSLVSMIADAVRVKVGIVERDPLEKAERMWLNLGHTFGHALEVQSAYALPHGQAVALGMIAAAQLSANRRLGDLTLPSRLQSTCRRLGLPVSTGCEPSAVRAAMNLDKKRDGRRLRFVLPVRIGEVKVVDDVSDDEILAALAHIST